MLRLGLLELGFRGGCSSAARVRQACELAAHAERLGFTRVWLPEHHGDPDLAFAAPEILTAVVAGATDRIRVGPAGILLRLYSPFKVAEVVRALEAAFPGRIDLGLAAGSVGPLSAQALLEGAPVCGKAEYDRKVKDLVGELRGELRGTHPLRLASAAPPDTRPPALWLLGSGAGSHALAARLGTGYSHALFFPHSDPVASRGVVHDYRRTFVVGPRQAAPACSVAVAAACAESGQGVRQALAEHTNRFIRPTLVGDPDACAAQLRRLAEAHGCAEVVVAPVGGMEARLACCELLAKALHGAPALDVEALAVRAPPAASLGR
jgi:luciferase family oxidoreductase group 1